MGIAIANRKNRCDFGALSSTSFRQKSLASLVSRDIPSFSTPTNSRGRPPPHQRISGPKSLGLGFFSWWTFRPRKKIFRSPPPPKKKKIPIRCRHPPGPSGPPLPENPPPLLGFSIKIDPPPSRRLGLPLPPARAEKNKKYPKRPPSFSSLKMI